MNRDLKVTARSARVAGARSSIRAGTVLRVLGLVIVVTALVVWAHRREGHLTHAQRASLPSQILFAEHRTILMQGTINQALAWRVADQLRQLEDMDARAPVMLFIDSPGGDLVAAGAVRDAMNRSRAPVYTHCLGGAEEMALLVLAHGAKGHRTASPAARLELRLPQALPNAPANAHAPTWAEEQATCRSDVLNTMAADTGHSAAQIERDALAVRRFDAAGAQRYGWIDAIER